MCTPHTHSRNAPTLSNEGPVAIENMARELFSFPRGVRACTHSSISSTCTVAFTKTADENLTKIATTLYPLLPSHHCHCSIRLTYPKIAVTPIPSLALPTGGHLSAMVMCTARGGDSSRFPSQKWCFVSREGSGWKKQTGSPSSSQAASNRFAWSRASRFAVSLGVARKTRRSDRRTRSDGPGF